MKKEGVSNQANKINSYFDQSLKRAVEPEGNDTNDNQVVPKRKRVTLEDMKVEQIARISLRNMLEKGKASEKEIELMQEKIYSKEIFGIDDSLLLAVNKSLDLKPLGYYTNPIKIYDELYYMYSKWSELPEKDNRTRLMEWISKHRGVEF